MLDVRERLSVKSVGWKLEKKVSKSVSLMLRMGNESLTKMVVLGWYEKFEVTGRVKECEISRECCRRPIRRSTKGDGEFRYPGD